MALAVVPNKQHVRRFRRGAPEHAVSLRCARTARALQRRLTVVRTSRTKDLMRAPISDRRPRAGMTLTPRHRQSRPLPMSAVTVRRSQFGEFELRPVREHAVPALTTQDDSDED